jgi:hypothetical protein
MDNIQEYINDITDLKDLEKIGNCCKKQITAIKSKYILDEIKNNPEVKKLNKKQINYIHHFSNFTCRLEKCNSFDDNNKYFKMMTDNLTLESYPCGFEERTLKINNKIFIEEHHWYHDIDNHLNKSDKEQLIKFVEVVGLTSNEFYKIISVIYMILLNSELYENEDDEDDEDDNNEK